jgi:hypothetical protein
VRFRATSLERSKVHWHQRRHQRGLHCEEHDSEKRNVWVFGLGGRYQLERCFLGFCEFVSDGVLQNFGLPRAEKNVFKKTARWEW